MSARAAVARILTGPNPPSGVVVGTSVTEAIDIAAGGVDGAGHAVTPSSRFDVASVTKVAATTSALMRLVSHGALDLDVPAGSILPELRSAADASIRDLLTHRAGLWEWQPLYFTSDPWKTVCELPLRYEPGAGRHYSDLGFMILGRIVSAVAGAPLDEAVRALVAEPLGLTSTGYGPVADAVVSGHGDATEQRMVRTGEPYPVLLTDPGFTWRAADIRGVVNDGNAAHAFGGVSGHAGLFTTVADLLALGRALLSGDFVDERVVADFFTEGADPGQALGWRTGRARLDGFDYRIIWHPGFTGCAFGVLPEAATAVAVLSNRLLAPEPRTTDSIWTDALSAVPNLTWESTS
ncbi:serine hydrolase domain-containing protein [Microbacterium sp. ZW T5_56]|uniref:serine hydrolase domain-containing protein n=1 Tax=Microbacterium sp. ZW T5_56 TaxID=3378081 RepID=UPI003853C7D5